MRPQNGVADYLMKPVAYSALLECFEKVKARLDARSAVQETAPKAYYDQIVYDVQQYLKDNYRTATLEEAAAKVSLSPAYLSRHVGGNGHQQQRRDQHDHHKVPHALQKELPLHSLHSAAPSRRDLRYSDGLCP